MKKQISVNKAIGKTIKRIGFSPSYCTGECVISFIDNTFLALKIDKGYERGEEEIVESDQFDILQFGDDVLVDVGIVTQEEIDKIRKDIHDSEVAINQAVQEAKDRKEYERLKKKYG